MGISTNLFEIYSPNEINQKLLLAWILSIFAQLHFEFLAKNQEGARKLEKEEISKLYIPCFEKISDEDKEKIILKLGETTSFNDLCNIKITELDKAWEEISRDREGFLAWMTSSLLEPRPGAFAKWARFSGADVR